MSIGGYKVRTKDAIHFITFAVVEWVDVFTRNVYCNILVDSLRYCQEHKGLVIHAWCLMSNHVHLIVAAKNSDLSDILCDFKKFTSRQIREAIQNNPKESRKQWMLRIFKDAGCANSRNPGYQFWRQDNRPKECYSPKFIAQKLRYVHQNPVAAGLVAAPEDYVYSSAKAYHFGKQHGLLKIDFL